MLLATLVIYQKRRKKHYIMLLKPLKNNTKITLTFALSYGSREEIVNAIKNISKKVVNNELDIEKIDEKIINNHLYTFNLPDVDLMIRTSGEQRISNFFIMANGICRTVLYRGIMARFQKRTLI